MFKRFCESDISCWYKLTSYWSCFSNTSNDRINNVKNYLRNTMKLSNKLIDLLIKNSREENWPNAFKTTELRERNKDTFKKLKGNSTVSRFFSNIIFKFNFYFFNS